MRGTSFAKFLGLTLAIAILASLAYYGYSTKSFSIGAKSIRQGMDIQGGVYIVYEPETDQVITPQQMDSAKEVIRKRLDTKGLFDASVTADNTKNRLIVEVPGEKDTQKAVDELGKTAKLRFVDADGNIIIQGNDVVNATSEYQQGSSVVGSGGWVVSLSLSPQAAIKFADATERVSKLASQNKNYISIFLDNTLLSSPSVSKRIDGGKAIIEGRDYTAASTKSDAALISSGALPFTLKTVQQDGIGPSLGKQALSISIVAGAISFIIVGLFMLVFYRLPGLVADLALVAYVAITILLISLFKITLTLPGIAGIILSVGMAVDANIIIFERVKEELRAGKTLRGAVDAGFKRALSPIIDANSTTTIVGAILFMFGTGPIRGFAVTLVLGVLLSLFSAITLTRYLLIQVMGFGFKHPWMYGYKGGSANA